MQKVDPDRLIPDPSKSIREGAIVLYKQGSANWRLRQIEHLAKVMKFSLDVPFRKLGKDVQNVILHGSGEREIKWKWKSEKGEYNWSSAFKGLVPLLEGKYKEVESEEARAELENYMSASPCPACKGRRLKPEALAVLVDGRPIDTLTALTLEDAQAFFTKLKPTPRELEIAGKILKEIRDRLGFLNDVGIGYLSLARASATLSGGEAQRIRLATQIGSQLMGVLYVLDEPSIGLHAKDNRKLIDTLVAMRDLGNTVVVVEHDEETIRLADRVVDLGPGAGIHGGEIVGEGHADELVKFPRSLTGKYLSGALRIPVPKSRRKATGKTLAVVGALGEQPQERHREIPAGRLHGGDGRLGLGKSTLVNDILLAARRAFPRGDGARRRSGSRSRARAPRQGHRHRPVAHRAHAPLEPRDVHERLQPDPGAHGAGSRCPDARLRPGALLVQREGGPLRELRGRRPDRDRNAFPAGHLRHLRRLRREALQPRDARGPLQGPQCRGHPRAHGRAGRRGLRDVPAIKTIARHAERRRPRLHPARPAGDDALGRRGAAREARAGAGAAGHRADPLHPRRADDRAPLRRTSGSLSASSTRSWTRGTRWS